MQYYIKAGSYLLENEEKDSGYLHIEAGKFGSFVDDVPVGSQVIDYSPYIVAPGLFDTHIHGISGYDVMDGNPQSILGISQAIASYGVTRFLPTTLTASNANLERALISVTEAVHAGLPGAQSEGIYVEGPYFSEKYKGAQNPNYFRDPSVAEFQKWQELAQGQIIKIAIAPELNGAKEFIRSIKNIGVYISIAHTNADYLCTSRAIEAGANNFTHLFNGMSGLHHRDPGVVGAALMNNDTYAELICDGHHLHPEIARLALQLKKEKLVLITDSMRATDMPDGEYMLGEYKVLIQDGVARTETGSLAGSTLHLIGAIKHLQHWSQYPLYKIWHLGSLSPANSVGKGAMLGSITKGKLADYVVLDRNFNVHVTAIEGKINYKKIP